MSYTSRWERLSDALMRVTESGGLTQNDAQSDICRAVADGAIRVRAKLKRHAVKRTTSTNTVLEGREFQVPTGLKAEDFDWQNSRPREPWVVRREALRVPGYWDLEWIELCRVDVTTVLCATTAAEESTRVFPRNASKLGHKRRSRPARERAQLAIEAVYPDGVPDQAIEPNGVFCWRVREWLERNHHRRVSDDTILRAACRRKERK